MAANKHVFPPKINVPYDVHQKPVITNGAASSTSIWLSVAAPFLFPFFFSGAFEYCSNVDF